MFEQKFGIEFEVYGKSAKDLSKLLKADYIRSWQGVGYYFTHSDKEYRIKTDQSVGYNGCEITTPILTEEDIPAVIELCKILKKEQNLGTHKKCGLHIHIGKSDNWSDDMTKILHINWKIVLPKIKSSFMPHAPRKEYCELDTRKWNQYKKYRALRFTENTVEFRFFNGSLNPRYLCRGLRVACGMMALAKQGEEIEYLPNDKALEKFIENKVKCIIS